MSIRIQQLSKSYGSERAVADVTFEVQDNELFAIVGASGCGKSTLLRLIAGLEQPDAGSISIAGREVASATQFVPPEQRQVGFVFQSYALWPHLTVLGNVAFPAQAQGATRDTAEQLAAEHLRTVALSELAERKPEALSGGQRQRVALARCLAGGVKTILMDEPLANLDPHLRNTMERELLRFHREAGATTVYITHDQREAMALADRMAVMQHGRFLQIGKPTDIFERPATVDVAHFIGRGAIQPVDYHGNGIATLAGRKIAIRAADGQPIGSAQALFRPSDIVLQAGTDSMTGNIEQAHYRGGVWEAQITVAGLPEPFEVSSDSPLQMGQPLAFQLVSGWVLPTKDYSKAAKESPHAAHVVRGDLAPSSTPTSLAL